MQFFRLVTVLVLTVCAQQAAAAPFLARDFFPMRSGAVLSYRQSSVEGGAVWQEGIQTEYLQAGTVLAGRRSNWQYIERGSGYVQRTYYQQSGLGGVHTLGLQGYDPGAQSSLMTYLGTGRLMLPDVLVPGTSTTSRVRLRGLAQYGDSEQLARGMITTTVLVGGVRRMRGPGRMYRALHVTILEHEFTRSPEQSGQHTDTVLHLWLSRKVGVIRSQMFTRTTGAGLNASGGSVQRRVVTQILPQGVPTASGEEPVNYLAGIYAPDYESQGAENVDGAIAAIVDAAQSYRSDEFSNLVGKYGVAGSGGGQTVLGLVELDDTLVQDALNKLASDGGTGPQNFLRVEFSYDPSELQALGMQETDVRPMWWDPTLGQWVVGGTTPAGEHGASVQGQDNEIGNWGIDTERNVVWVNANHSSFYGIVVPEPAVTGLLVLGGIGLVLLRRGHRYAG